MGRSVGMWSSLFGGIAGLMAAAWLNMSGRSTVGAVILAFVSLAMLARFGREWQRRRPRAERRQCAACARPSLRLIQSIEERGRLGTYYGQTNVYRCEHCGAEVETASDLRLVTLGGFGLLMTGLGAMPLLSAVSYGPSLATVGGLVLFVVGVGVLVQLGRQIRTARENPALP